MRYARLFRVFGLVAAMRLSGCESQTQLPSNGGPTTKPSAVSQPTTRPTLRYTANRDRSESATHVPFWVPPVGNTEQLYRDPMLGLDIQSLNADGVLVTPREEIVRFAKFPDASALDHEQGSMQIYQVPVRVSPTGTARLEVLALKVDGFRIRSFDFPAGANNVVIRYRIRYANAREFDSELSQPMELELRHIPLANVP
jgi:hypothetical protein